MDRGSWLVEHYVSRACVTRTHRHLIEFGVLEFFRIMVPSQQGFRADVHVARHTHQYIPSNLLQEEEIRASHIDAAKNN